MSHATPPTAPWVRFTGLLARFGLVGVANTIVGLSITSALDLGLHVNPQVANGAGYAVGMVQSYVLNRGFVFRDRSAARASGPKFVVSMLVAFALNQVVLFIVVRALGPAAWAHFSAQALSMAIYTITVFLLCRHWVFRATS